MAGKQKKLCVVSCGNQHYIQVLSSRANALAAFLRGKGIQVAPPGPCDDTSDTVALMGKVDVVRVQSMLEGWA
jgi:hypothetical protein